MNEKKPPPRLSQSRLAITSHQVTNCCSKNLWKFHVLCNCEVLNKYFKFALPKIGVEHCVNKIHFPTPPPSTNDWFYLKRKELRWLNQPVLHHKRRSGRTTEKKKVIFVDKGSGQQSQTGKCEYKSNELRQKLFCIFRRVDWGPRLCGRDFY